MKSFKIYFSSKTSKPFLSKNSFHLFWVKAHFYPTFGRNNFIPLLCFCTFSIIPRFCEMKFTITILQSPFIYSFCQSSYYLEIYLFLAFNQLLFSIFTQYPDLFQFVLKPVLLFLENTSKLQLIG